MLARNRKMRVYKFILRAILCVLAFNINLFIHADNIPISDDADFRIVQTESGLIRGKKDSTIFNKIPYYSFRGIPYAKPPLKELRFKPPQKHDSWPDVRDAFNFGNECVQPMLINSEWKGNEDCLFLNVYVPAESTPKSQLPVMFYLHWGAYFSGSSNIFGPDFLIEHDVIIITINYRVGPFGFLSLGTPEYSGNMGLKDQLLALKWVNKNVESFGGDPSKVTLFGYSAGSASANFHIISPASRGLFQRAILSSGSVLNPWAYTERSHISILQNFALQIFYPVDNMEELIKMLKIVDAELLSRSTFQNLIVPIMSRRINDLTWSPVVEHPDAVEPFLNRTPIEILSDENYSDDVDILIGHTSDEVYILMMKDLIRPPPPDAFANVDLEFELPIKNIQTNFRSKEYAEIEKRFRGYYFKNGVRSNSNHSDTFKEFNNFYTDVSFAYGIDLFAKIHANTSTGKTFFYLFSADTGLNLFKRFSTARMYGLSGATHGDDVFYLFRLHGQMPYISSLYNLKDTSIEREIIKNMTKIYTNFAKYGNPSPNADPIDFKPFESVRLNYVDITNEGMVLKLNPNEDSVNFWNSIFMDFSYLWKKQGNQYENDNIINNKSVILPIGIILSLVVGAIFIKTCRLICFSSNKSLV